MGRATASCPGMMIMESAPFTIERARESDLPAILAVLERYNMHNIPSEEMPSLDLGMVFVARIGAEVVGVGGYKMLSNAQGKTTVLAVSPEHRRKGIGEALQRRRMEEMVGLGARSIITNADRPESISWYKRRFGYVEIGRIDKKHPFGHPDVLYWTSLEWRSGPSVAEGSDG